MAFDLYAVDTNGADVSECPVVGHGKLGLDGTIAFFDEYGENPKLATGWYAIDEGLSGLAADIFKYVGPQYFYITAVKADSAIKYLVGGGATFDYNAFYTIMNGYGSGYVIGYPGLNDAGDVFPIAVKNADTGAVYPSFCFNAGSRAFAGESGLDCSGYLVAERMGKVSDYEDFVSAYNYIEDVYGSLDDYRAITQIITWHLLDAIAIPSDEFDGIDWNAVETGTGAVHGIADAKGIIEDVAANYKGYVGKGKIVDLAIMLCERNHNPADCQPQLVPLYESGAFDNIAKSSRLAIDPAAAVAAELTVWTQKYKELYQREGAPYKYYSQSYGSVTATNAGVKTNIVANSNHFAFAKLPVTDLEAGVTLDMVVGNKVSTCGSAFVKLVDGKLEITIDAYKSSFGAVAFMGFMPTVKNGNIHSVGIFKHDNNSIIDIYTLKSFQSSDKKGANYDKDWADLTNNVKIDNDYIYLYIHGDFVFDLTSSVNPGAGFVYDPSTNTWWGSLSDPQWIGESKAGDPTSRTEEIELEIEITITYEDSTVLYSGTITSLDDPAIVIDEAWIGEYAVVWHWAYPGGYPAAGAGSAVVVVKPGMETYFDLPKISITQIEVEKSYTPGVKGVYDEGIDEMAYIPKTATIIKTIKGD